jgi:hypothetical protein
VTAGVTVRPKRIFYTELSTSLFNFGKAPKYMRVLRVALIKGLVGTLKIQGIKTPT